MINLTVYTAVTCTYGSRKPTKEFGWRTQDRKQTLSIKRHVSHNPPTSMKHRYPLSEFQKPIKTFKLKKLKSFQDLHRYPIATSVASSKPFRRQLKNRSQYLFEATKVSPICFANPNRSDTCPTDTARGKPLANFISRGKDLRGIYLRSAPVKAACLAALQKDDTRATASNTLPTSRGTRVNRGGDQEVRGNRECGTPKPD